MDKLLQAIDLLETRRKGRVAKGQPTASSCLGDVRWALGKVGLKLPPPMKAPDNTAIANFHAIVEDPEAFGWVQVHHPLPSVCLTYYKRCGNLKGGRIAGHICLLHNGVLYANNAYDDGTYWHERIIGAFVPE